MRLQRGQKTTSENDAGHDHKAGKEEKKVREKEKTIVKSSGGTCSGMRE